MRRERVFARATAAGDGGGTVLTLASLQRGSGESGPRFAALSDELGAVLAARTANGGSRRDP
jgi:cytochrome c biogenesis protein